MDPTYVYEKGKGWVPQTIDSYVFTLTCGTVVRMEHRKPNPGEKFSNCQPGSKDYQKDGKPLFETFAALYKSFSFDRLSTMRPDDWRLTQDRIWITFVPVI